MDKTKGQSSRGGYGGGENWPFVLPSEGAWKKYKTLHLVNPAHTTMDCAQCGARAKHALPLSERTYTCTACGAVSPRDKNSARVMLIRAGLNPAGADRVRPGRPLDGQAA